MGIVSQHLGSKELWDAVKPYLLKEAPCVICSGQIFESWAKENFLEAKKCRHCGMISVNPHLSKEGLALVYENYFNYRQDDLEKKKMRDHSYDLDYQWVFNFVKEGKVLDVGCSGGHFLNHFPPAIFERQGVEIDSDAQTYAEQQYKIPVIVGDVLDMDAAATFDLVTLRGTIEHFSDPIAVLKKCVQMLKTGGHLYITATPAGDSFAFDVYRDKWQLFTPIVHIHFFSVQLLTQVLSRFGMCPVAHYYQYEETRYVNHARDFKQIQEDIVKIHSGKSQDVKTSVPFPGSMLSAIWIKK